MNGCTFKRRLTSGRLTWGYKFDVGRDQNGKRLFEFKTGFETKTAAAAAMRTAISEFEKTHGKITRHRGILGTITWGYEFGDIRKNGFADRSVAEADLAGEVGRRAAAEQTPAEVDPTLADYIKFWLDEHASRRTAPKTLERYREFARYLTRHLGQIRLNELTPAQIQRTIHALEDHGGMVTKEQPNGRPLAAKTVRHIGTLLYTCLAEADRLGVLKIPHPMRNKRVRLPKLPKRKPAVVDKEKLKALLDRARSTRLYPFIVMASATDCRRGELLALLWTDLNETTGELSVSKSLEQTRAGLRVKSTKSGDARKFVVPEPAIAVLDEHRAVQDGDRQLFGSDYQDNGLVFCQPNGSYYSPDRVGARVKELMVAVGLEHVSLHSLRHTFASELLSNGVPITEVSERLGHADKNITLAIYSHAMPADSRAAAKVWNDALGDVIQIGKKPVTVRRVAHGCTEGLKAGTLVENKRG